MAPTSVEHVEQVEQLKSAIKSQLDAIECAGDFFSNRESSEEGLNPGLHIKNLGRLGLPLYERDVRALIQCSQQSPFGKGEETIIDTAVRNSWEINADQISFTHPDWPRHETKILASVCADLGVHGGSSNVRAELYKMLIYEEGAMFKPHRDSEKAPGMFGTMVICLPSPHKGGDVIVSFDDKSMVLNTSQLSEWSSCFLAWYSDVLHEVKPVESGFRVVLTYNLIYTSATQFPSLAKFENEKAILKNTITRWLASYSLLEEMPSCLVYPLEHSYTAANLSSDHLKGKDTARAVCMGQLAEELGFTCALAIVERTTMTQGDEDTNDDVQLNDVVSLEGRSIVQQAEVSHDTFVTTKHWDRAPDREEEEFTGNAGVERTYWYKDTVSVMPQPLRNTPLTVELQALIIMPSEHLIDLELASHSWGKMKFIIARVDLLLSGPGDPRHWQDVRRLCQVVMEAAPIPHRIRGDREPYTTAEVTQLLEKLLQAGLEQIVEKSLPHCRPHLAEVALKSYRRWLQSYDFELLKPG